MCALDADLAGSAPITESSLILRLVDRKDMRSFNFMVSSHSINMLPLAVLSRTVLTTIILAVPSPHFTFHGFSVNA